MQAVANFQRANWPGSFAGLGAGSLLGNVEIVAVCGSFHRGAGFELQRDKRPLLLSLQVHISPFQRVDSRLG